MTKLGIVIGLILWMSPMYGCDNDSPRENRVEDRAENREERVEDREERREERREDVREAVTPDH